MGYETWRHEAPNFDSVVWEYLVMDEAHVLKSLKSKTAASGALSVLNRVLYMPSHSYNGDYFVSVRSIRAQSKIALTGTPVQNGVS